MSPKEEARRIVNINWAYQIRITKKPDWEHAKQIAKDITNEKMLIWHSLRESLGDVAFENIEFYKDVLINIDKL